MLDRRTFVRTSVTGAAAISLSPALLNGQETVATETEVPNFLKNVSDEYGTDPRAAAKQWFKDARFGLFMHYGLYSILGRHEWVQFKEKIHVAEYAKLVDQFDAKEFDADLITDLALEAGMKYVNITTRHHDSFCLFDSKYTDFKSTNSPAKRDLLAELAENCNQKGLGLYLYYSHGRDWRHPHAPNNGQWGGNARPKFETKEPFYKYGDEHDLNIYVEFMKNQITELLTNYGPIGAIWLDGHSTPASRPKKMDQFKLQELYDHIHSLQPQVLVSYKQGLLGTEDFKAPERKWKKKSDVPLELCDTLQPHGWGYTKADDDKHKDADQVMKMLERAKNIDANLLLNTGPLPSGKIHPEDVATLKEVGRRLKQAKNETGEG